jgi:flavodoxin
MALLIVYYSKTGSTGTVASALARATGGTLRELVDASPRSNQFAAAMAALFKRSARLVGPDYDVSAYQRVVIMTPIWVGNPTPAFNAFMRNVSLEGKDVVLVAVGESSENIATRSRLEQMAQARGGRVQGVHHIHGLDASGRAGPSATSEELQKAGEHLAGVLRTPQDDEGGQGDERPEPKSTMHQHKQKP